MKDEKIYLLTDGCLWEINKQMGNEHPHATEVVDLETGAVRYIKSGSKIRFVEGEISDIRTQKLYNQKTKEAEQKVSSNKQDLQKRTKRKGTSLRREFKRKIKSL
jgi:hypothetical protein